MTRHKGLVGSVFVTALFVLSGWAMAGNAVAQPAASEPATAVEAGDQELSPEDANAAPFPPGKHAALVKKVCTECHMAAMVVNRKFSHEEAVRTYKLMIGSDIENDQARNIIEYLSTTLGR